MAVEPRPAPSEPGQPELVSAIVLNWNGGEDLQRAVASLLEQQAVRVQIIVVDRIGRRHSGLRLHGRQSATDRRVRYVRARCHQPRTPYPRQRIRVR